MARSACRRAEPMRRVRATLCLHALGCVLLLAGCAPLSPHAVKASAAAEARAPEAPSGWSAQTPWQGQRQAVASAHVLASQAGLDMLRAVSAKTYRRLDLPDGDGERLGFIAQEVMEVYPEAVDVPSDPEEMMGLRPTDIIPVCVSAIKELEARVEAQEARIKALESRLDSQTSPP